MSEQTDDSLTIKPTISPDIKRSLDRAAQAVGITNSAQAFEATLTQPLSQAERERLARAFQKLSGR